MCWQRHDRFDARQAAAPARRPDVRVSDADRHAVIDELQRHTADGRLTLDEFEERVDEVLAARTGAELDATMRDLPPAAVAAAGRRRTRVPVRTAVVTLVVVGLLLAGHWWVLIPVGFFAFGGCGHHAPSTRTRQQDERDEAVIHV